MASSGWTRMTNSFWGIDLPNIDSLPGGGLNCILISHFRLFKPFPAFIIKGTPAHLALLIWNLAMQYVGQRLPLGTVGSSKYPGSSPTPVYCPKTTSSTETQTQNNRKQGQLSCFKQHFEAQRTTPIHHNTRHSTHTGTTPHPPSHVHGLT